MSAQITASGFRNPLLNTRFIDIDMLNIPVSGTEVLFGFIGMIDAERPNFHSAELTSVAMFSQPVELIAKNVGAGGNSFPAGFIVALKNPSVTSGTLRVEFDENVAVMNGVGLVYSGLDTASSFIPHTGPVLNTQLPDFKIDDSFVVPSGNLVLDLCVSESSNHITHVLSSGSVSTSVFDESISMHRMSVVSQLTASGGPALLEREDCGGPFAGVTLTAVSIGIS